METSQGRMQGVIPVSPREGWRKGLHHIPGGDGGCSSHSQASLCSCPSLLTPHQFITFNCCGGRRIPPGGVQMPISPIFLMLSGPSFAFGSLWSPRVRWKSPIHRAVMETHMQPNGEDLAPQVKQCLLS